MEVVWILSRLNFKDLNLLIGSGEEKAEAVQKKRKFSEKGLDRGKGWQGVGTVQRE